MSVPLISLRFRSLARYLAAFILVTLCCFVAFRSQAQTKSPYSRDRLLTAIRTNTKTRELSDQQFVGYIQQRGVDFQITASDEAELRIAGASNEVIAAIGANYRRPSLPKGMGSLTITSNLPDCKVFVNGQFRGTTETNGGLSLSPLRAGQYKIALRRENYEEAEHSVTVAAGVEATENFLLTGVKGRLTVNSNTPGVQVRLNGVEYSGGVRDMPLPADAYEVRVSKPGFRTFTKSVTVTPRGSVSVDAVLEAVSVDQLVAQAETLLQANRYPETMAISREILSLYPDNAQATALLGLAYYYTGKYSESAGVLTRAIALGGQFALPIRHHHKAVFNDELCTGTLTIGRGVLGFTSLDRTGHDFIVPANKIYELTSEPRKAGRVHVQVGIQKGSKEDKKTYNFHVSHAGIRPFDSTNPTSISVAYCTGCDEETQLLYRLLQQLKDAPPPASAPPQSVPDAAAGRPTLKRESATDSGAGVNANTIQLPSERFRDYSNAGKYKLGVPDNWKPVVNTTQNIVFAPDGASQLINSRTNFTRGIQIAIVPTRGLSLPQAFEQLITAMLKGESYMRQVVATQQGEIKGRPALTAGLKGVSPVTQRDEFALVYAVLLKSGDLFCVIAVSPQDEVSAYSATFGRIIGSIEFLN